MKVYGLDLNFDSPPESPTFQSMQIEPNPLYTQTMVRFSLTNGGKTALHFFDVSGRLVHSIMKNYDAGEHIEVINARDLLSGEGLIYCQLVCHGYTEIQRMVLLK